MKCAFSETEAFNIQKSLCKNDNNDLDDTNNTMDWIFLLSADEVERYMPIRKDRRVLATEYTLDSNKVYEQNDGYSEWWLRSVDYKDEYVTSDGYIMNTTNKSRTGIRPAMWYNLPEGAKIEEKDAYDSITVLKEESFAVGDTLNFGSYEQDYDSMNGSEPITWQILDIDEDNVALAISVNVLNRMTFFEHGYGEQSLRKSELIGWLNKEFVSQAFTDEEITYMQNFPLDDVRASFKVGILLTSEVEQFMSVLKEGLEADTEYVKCEYEEYGGSNVGWWVYKHRDPEDMEESLPYLAEEEIGEYKLNLGKGEGMIVSYESGEIEYYDNMYSAGIRPLIRIQLNHSLKQNGTTGEQQNNTAIDAVHEAQNIASTNCQWEIREDNTVSLLRYTGKGYKIIIPEEYKGLPVTEIADGAFEECSLLREVVIPENVIRIGTKAFYKCNMLEKVVLPAGEIEFGKFAFNNCPNVVLYVQVGSPAEAYAQGRTLEYSNK